MHRVESRTYIGEPGETVTLTTQLDGGGVVSVTVDGTDIGAARSFTLPTAGGARKLQIALVGPLGASCVVTIAAVDGALDGDFLMCQAHDPAPVHFYSFAVAAPAVVASFALAVGAPVAKKAGRKRGRK
jgi:hypothetical protein